MIHAEKNAMCIGTDWDLKDSETGFGCPIKI